MKFLYELDMGVGRHEEDIQDLFEFLYDNDFMCAGEVRKGFKILVRKKG